MKNMHASKIIVAAFVCISPISFAQSSATEKTISIGQLQWDIHEVIIATVKKYAQATGFISSGEKEGGSFIYEAGWTRKTHWNWRQPFGIPGKDNEPAVHLNFHEAKAICSFFGKRLPTDSEWTSAAFLEQRQSPPQPFVKGKRYTYANGDTPQEFALPEWLCRSKRHRPIRFTMARQWSCASNDYRARGQRSI